MESDLGKRKGYARAFSKEQAILLTLLSIFIVTVLVPFSFCQGGSDIQGDSWCKFQHDLQNSGYINNTVPSSIRQKWNFTTLGTGAINYPPVVSDGRVFFGSDDGNFYCLNETNGNLLWVRQIGACSASAAVDSSRRLVFVAEYSKGSAIYALDEFTGETKWLKQADFGANYPIDDADLNRPWYAPPTIDFEKGFVYFGGMTYWVDPPDPGYYWARRANSIYCIDEVEGTVVWKAIGDYANKPNTPLPLIYTCPAIENGKLFFGVDGWSTGYSTTGVNLIAPPQICAVNQTDGSFLWQKDIGGWGGDYVRSSPALAFGDIFIGSSDRNFYVLNSDSGQVRWQYSTGGAVESSPAVDLDKRIVFVGSNDGSLYCFSEYGVLVWSKSFDLPVKSAPVVADDKVLLSTQNMLNALNESSGRGIWSFSTSGTLTSPVISNSVIFVGSTDGRIYALFTTQRIPTSLADPTTTAVFNQTFPMSTRLIDKNHNPVADATVTFSLFSDAAWKQVYTQRTDSDGYASTTYRPDLPSGTYDIRVDFLGDFYYENSSFAGQLTIAKAPATLSLLNAPFEINYSKTVALVTQLKDAMNNSLAAISISYQIQVATSWNDIGTSVTDTDGMASLNYTAAALPSVYALRAVFEGNVYYQNQTSESFIQIDKAVTTMSDPSASAIFGENVLVQARLSNDANIPISGCIITFWLDLNDGWSQIGLATTNINGYATISLSANQPLGQYELRASFEGDDYYWGQLSIGILSINSRILIDHTLSSSSMADVGSIQKVQFHVSWQLNGSSLESGDVFINGTRVAINSTGWAEMPVTSQSATLDKWIVTGADCNGATIFAQYAPDPDIIWNQVLITLATSFQRIDVGKIISIETTGKYTYDGQTFYGTVYLNDSSLTLDHPGQKSYMVARINDPLYGLTSVKSNTLSVTWDVVKIVLAGKNRVNVGEQIFVSINARYSYDDAPFIGRIILNDSAMQLNVVGEKTYGVEEVVDNANSVSNFSANVLSVVWDKVEVALQVAKNRIDVGSHIQISLSAVYLSNRQPFDGVVSLNDTVFVSSLPTQKFYTVAGVSASSDNITAFSSNVVSVIWDEVVIDLSTSKQRVEVGKNVTIAWSGTYAFDGRPFIGDVFLNDTTQSLSYVGSKSYEVASVSDESFGLTQFHSNIITIVWDRIHVDYTVENPSLGVLNVRIWVYSEYENGSIKNAQISVDNIEVTNEGDGSYYCQMLNWGPYLSASMTVDIGNDFQLSDQKIAGVLSFNFLVELVAVPVILALIIIFLAYIRNKKRKKLIALASELDPKIVAVAKDWGGLVTLSIVIQDLHTPLEVAKESLERFARCREATKIVVGNNIVYDFYLVRMQMARVDQKIYSTMKDAPSGLRKEQIEDLTELPSNVVETTLDEMEKDGKIVFDSVSGKYRLKVFESS